MNKDNELILEQAEKLYNVKLDHEITMGSTNNRIFEVKGEQTAYILRASEYSLERKEHTAFEMKWVEYLSSHLTGIVRPQKSKYGNLYEVINTAAKAYILCLLEKAPGKIVDANHPNEFNPELFFHLGALMGDMHRLTVSYEGNIRKPAFEWTSYPNA